jgi:homocysteine S-methyltransferase
VGQFAGGEGAAVTVAGAALPRLTYTHRDLPLEAGCSDTAAARAVDGLLARSPLWLDGGFATELEGRGHDLRSALWSAGVLAARPDEVRAVHDSFLAAGCHVVATASYQVSRAGFEHEGKPGWDAALRASIDIAHAAVVAAYRARGGTAPAAAADGGGGGRSGDGPAAVAISLGPAGAVWHDGSEFTGTYGLPGEGPVVPITAALAPGRQSVESLKAFHRERLAVVSHHLAATAADSPHAFVVAFETVPCLMEVTAIAQLLAHEFRHLRAWISVTAASGTSLVSGEPLRDVAVIAGSVAPEQVVAVGVNCCDPRATAGAVATLASVPPPLRRRVVAYPNRGECWDAATGGWRAGGGEPSDEEWIALARQWVAAGAWGVGGCCRTTPALLAAVHAAAGAASGGEPAER